MAKIRWTEVLGIYEKVQMLDRFPESGYKLRNEQEGEIRILLYGHFRIAYLLKEKDQIDILGIFHGALDIEKYFGKVPPKPKAYSAPTPIRKPSAKLFKSSPAANEKTIP